MDDQPIKHRKDIDDDIRDIVSDMSEDMNLGHYVEREEEEKKIDVEPGEVMLHNADDLSNIDQAEPSESVSDYPFMDIGAETEK